MPGEETPPDAADDDWPVRLAGVWRKRFALPQAAEDADGWADADPWAFKDWPDLGATLERLQKCAKAGAIGAAFDAIYATEAHRRWFWREAQKPMRPAPGTLLDIAADLPAVPTWALECVGQWIVSRRNLADHRRHIKHRLRAWAVAELADVRQAAKEERFGSDDEPPFRTPPLWERLVAAGASEAEARAAAEREHRRFTPELTEEDAFDRIREILSDTALRPVERKKERDGDSIPDGDALRASTRLVRKAFLGGWQERFYLPSDRALCALGMADLAGMPAEIDRRIGRLFARP